MMERAVGFRRLLEPHAAFVELLCPKVVGKDVDYGEDEMVQQRDARMPGCQDARMPRAIRVWDEIGRARNECRGFEEPVPESRR